MRVSKPQAPLSTKSPAHRAMPNKDEQDAQSQHCHMESESLVPIILLKSGMVECAHH